MSEPGSDNTLLIGAAAGVLSVVLCMGFGTTLCSATFVSWLFRSEPTVAQQEEGPTGPIEVTRPGRPVRLPPLPPSITSGPPIPPSPIHRDQCSDIVDGGPLLGDGTCATAEIHCDEMIIGHTLGGVDEYDSDFYEDKHCWPRLIDHDGGDERVYKLVMPPGEWRAWVTLHTPCADLDVMAIRHDTDTCPTTRSNINQCEMKAESSTRPERFQMTSQTSNGRQAVWWIVVEGKRNEEGPFSLHVQCAAGLSGGYH